MSTFLNNDPYSIAYGGETNDKPTETVDSIVGTVAATPSGTFSQTGTKSEALDMSANANKSYLQALTNGAGASLPGILVVSFAAALSAAPSSELAVITNSASATAPAATDPKYIRIGTDRKLYLCDKNGNALAGGVSTTLIPTSGAMKEVCISFDGLNHSTAWIKVYFDGVEELAFDSKLTWANLFDTSKGYFYFGELCPAGSNHGCTLYLDDAVCRFSDVASEALHRTAYPRIRVAVPVTATAQATFNAWAPRGTGSSANHWVNIQTNDGTTSELFDTVLSDVDSWKSSTANPMPGGATVIKAQLRQVQKNTSGKTAADMVYGPTGTPHSQTTAYLGSVSTAYTARICAFLYQDGGSTTPVYADFNANASEWGVINPGAGSANNAVTFSPGPEAVYYTATLPLGMPPPPLNNAAMVGLGSGVF